MKLTKVFDKLIAHHVGGARIIAQQGGTSSSKTYSTLQLLLIIAAKHPGLLISVVAESLPHLKRGALRDFINILEEEGIYSERIHNKTDNSFKIGGSVIEFFGADSPDKLRGARRDYLFLNECNNISYAAFNQLEPRTKTRVFLDYNPVAEFWVHEHLLDKPGVAYIQSTYLDNDFLDPSIIKSIERRRETDPAWFKVYGLGETGRAEGLVFNKWDIVDDVPDSKLLGYGLDFGYTNDPSAAIAVYLAEGTLYFDELIYSTGLTNDDLFIRARKAKIDMQANTYADSAEPKSIEELFRLGWRGVRPVVKGADSIRNGIQVMQTYNIKVTKRSTNLIKELRNYQWATDKYGEPLNKPSDNWNHCIDSARYCCMMTVGSEKDKGKILSIDFI